MLDALIARILQKGIEEASKAELNYFVERFLGKLPETTNLNGNMHGAIMDWLAGRVEKAKAPPPADAGDDDEDFE